MITAAECETNIIPFLFAIFESAVSPWQMQEQRLNFTSLPRDKSSVQYSPARRNLGGQHCIAAAQFKTLPHRTNVNRDDGRWDIARNLQAM